MAKHDTSEPILVLVRRGRKGRGFSVSPVEDVSNSASCVDDKEIGEVIVEMLDDENQPRVHISDLLAAGSGAPPSRSSAPQADEPEGEDDEEEEDEYEDEGDEYEGGGSPIDDVLSGDGDLADRAILWGLSSIISKGRSMSSAKVRPSGARKKKKKKKKKS